MMPKMCYLDARGLIFSQSSVNARMWRTKEIDQKQEESGL